VQKAWYTLGLLYNRLRQIASSLEKYY